MSVASSSSTTRAYVADPAHSAVLFEVRHLITKVRGRFSDFACDLELDEARPDRARVALVVQAASIDTNDQARDTHLKSDDFFAVDRFPTVTFTSSRVIDRGGNQFEVAGELTIRGVTQPIVLPVRYLGKAKDPWGTEKLAFDTEVTLDRTEFGLVWNAPLESGGFLLGDSIRVTISIQAQATSAVTGA